MTYSRPPKGTQHTGPKKDFGPALMVVISVLILVLCGVGYAIYELKSHPDVGASFSSYTARVRQWMADRKQRLGQGIASVKTAAQTSEDAVPAVKFEFYNQLPEMQIEKTIVTKAAQIALEPKPLVVEDVAKKLADVTPVSKAPEQKPLQVEHKPVVAKTVARPGVMHKTIVKKKTTTKIVAHRKRQAKRYVAKKKPIKVVVSRATDLENDLLATIKNTAGGK